MDVRLISVKEDFEKAYNILNQKEYPLSFYEFCLKHDRLQNEKSLKLIGVFQQDDCVGFLSYKITVCPYLDRILEIKEIHQTSIKTYKTLLSFIDSLAIDEDCRAIKMNKNKKVERLNHTLSDKFENFLKGLFAS
jgi:hypothetical protein